VEKEEKKGLNGWYRFSIDTLSIICLPLSVLDINQIYQRTAPGCEGGFEKNIRWRITGPAGYLLDATMEIDAVWCCFLAHCCPGNGLFTISIRILSFASNFCF